MRPTQRPILALVITIAFLSVSRTDGHSQSPPTPATVTPAQFNSLRWLEGTWLGTQNGENPFYEGYRFINDSTIRTFTLQDSTARQPSDSGAIILKHGVVSSGSGNTLYVVTALDSTSVHFEPVRNARNSFTWTRTSPDSWTATLQWTDQQGTPQQRIYRMRRLRSSGQ
jgi:hypothetical protein